MAWIDRLAARIRRRRRAGPVLSANLLVGLTFPAFWRPVYHLAEQPKTALHREKVNCGCLSFGGQIKTFLYDAAGSAGQSLSRSELEDECAAGRGNCSS